MGRRLVIAAVLALVLLVLLGCRHPEIGYDGDPSCLGCGPFGPREAPQPRQQGGSLGVSTCQQMEDAINAPGIPPRGLQQRYREECL